MSIVFVGTPEFAVPSLLRLHESGHEITAVITQPDRPSGRGRTPRPPPIKIAAEELGLPVFQPEGLRDPGVLESLRTLAPEVMVVVAYGEILRQPLLDVPPRGTLNVHASLLPRHRGASPIAGAILAGDTETGVTIMLMDAGMDTGPILAQRSVPLAGDETTGTLTNYLAELGADLLDEALPLYLAGEITPQAQDDSQATTTRLIKKEDGAIDWSLPAIDISRRVRAFNPWPGATTSLSGEQLHIWRASAVAGSSEEPPGTIVVSPAEFIDPAVVVQTGNGFLVIEQLQRPGRKSVTAAEFLRGQRNLIGQRLT